MGLLMTFFTGVATVVVLLLSVFYWRIKKAYEYFVNKEIKGPKPSFPVGTWNQSARKFLGSEDIKNVENLGAVVGTFDGLTPNLLIADSEIIQKILRTEAAKFRSRRAQETKYPTLKAVLQILNDDDQNEVLALLNSPSNTHKIKKLLPRLEISSNAFVRAIIKAREGSSPAETGSDVVQELNTTVRVNDVVAELVEDVTALTLLGVDLNADPVFRQGFIKQCKNIFAINNSSSSLAAIPYLYGGALNWAINRNALEYFKGLISSEIKERSREQPAESKAADLIDILLEIAEEEKKTATKEKAQDKQEEQNLVLTDRTLTNLILSAVVVLNHWTRSNILFSLHALAKNPQIQEKLLQELKNAQETENVSTEAVDKLPYLDAFVKEVARLYPTEFRLEKVAVADVDLSETLHVDKGTAVSIPVFALHNSSLFHSEPEKFSPERFLSDVYENQHPCIPLPNTTSIAAKLGNLATKVAVVKIVSKLKLATAAGPETQVYQTGLTGVPFPADIRVVAELRE